jgi:alpha-1,2-mannosyltransferase
VRVPARLAAVAATVAAAWFVSARSVFPPWHRWFDLRVYRGAVGSWLDGRPLYAFTLPGTSKGFTYPPFGAAVLAPLAAGSVRVDEGVATALSVLLLVATTAWLVAPVARRHGRPVWFAVALAVPVAVAMEPVRDTLGWGQINLVLVALVLADVAALGRGSRWAGIGTGLATAVKLTPALFVVLFFLAGRRRAAGVAVGTFLAATLLGLLLDPGGSVRFWTSTLWQTDRVGAPDRTENQSLLGLVARLQHTARPDHLPWLLLSAAVLAVGLWRAARAARAGDLLVGVVITGLLTCLVSPISWTHHLYWVVPAVLVLADVAASSRGPRRAGAATAAVVVLGVFASSLVWFFGGLQPGPRSGGLGGVLGENAYVLVMLALVVLLPARRLTPVAPSAARTTAPPRPAGSSPR